MQRFIRNYLTWKGVTLAGELRQSEINNQEISIRNINFIPVPGVYITTVPAVGEYMVCFEIKEEQVTQQISFFNFHEQGKYVIKTRMGINDMINLTVEDILSEESYALSLAVKNEEYETAAIIKNIIEQEDKKRLQSSIEQLIS